MLSPALVPLLLAAFNPVFSERVTTPAGTLSLGLGRLSEPLQGELRGAARTFALSKRAELGLPVTSTLGPAEAFGTRFGASFHLVQQVDGVDVYGAKVVVTLDRNRRVVQLASSLVGYRQAVLDWRMSPAQALAVAAREVPMALLQPGGAPYGGTRRQLFAVGDEVHSGYFTFVPSVDRTRNWFVAIDATNGQVLWRQNRVFHSEAAQVYASSPGGLDAGVGVMPLLQVELKHSDGGSMVVPNDGGYLQGDLLVSYGCCPNKGCDTGPDAGPKRADGGMQYSGLTVQYDVVECDRVQRATNDPAQNPDASFLYPPHDPPATRDGGAPGPVVQADLADSDPFSEVFAFYQVNRAYDFIRGLSSAAAPIFPGNVPPIEGFKTRDAKRVPPRQTAVWSNVTIPDYEELQANISIVGCLTGGPCTTHTDKLARVDNAAYMARENFSQIVLPDYMLDVDTLMLFQGGRADFGYDGPVLWHEFGHGVIYATAAFESFTVDARSANNEGGAMHEGLADYLAAAQGQNPLIGEYVGPRMAAGGGGANLEQDVSMRNLENTFACPEVLWGEVHQDSQHFSAALWEARKTHFQGTDLGRTFDAAVYAALVSMVPTTDFTGAAAIIVAHLPAAFPGVAGADTKMEAIFDARGVTNCSKVVDMTGATLPRPAYGIGGRTGAGLAAGSRVPGPYQMKLLVPQGAKSVTVAATGQANMVGQVQTEARLLARVGSPITFTRTGNALTNDADVTGAAPAITGATVRAQALIDVPCGAEVYFTLATTSGQGENLRDLAVTFEPAASCTVDAGTDAGPVADAGAIDGGAKIIDAIEEGGKAGAGNVPEGCGCTSAIGGLPAFAVLCLLGLARLRRRGRSA